MNIEGEQRPTLSSCLMEKDTFAMNLYTLVETKMGYTSTFYTCVTPHVMAAIFLLPKTWQCKKMQY
jgi:hypothetical protein